MTPREAQQAAVSAAVEARARGDLTEAARLTRRAEEIQEEQLRRPAAKEDQRNG